MSLFNTDILDDLLAPVSRLFLADKKLNKYIAVYTWDKKLNNLSNEKTRDNLFGHFLDEEMFRKEENQSPVFQVEFIDIFSIKYIKTLNEQNKIKEELKASNVIDNNATIELQHGD